MKHEKLSDRVKALRRRIQVTNSLKSGTSPLSLFYCQINSCENNAPMAYRTITVVNSMAVGRLLPRDYMYAVQDTDTALRIADWTVREAMAHINQFEEAGRNVEFITIRIPVSVIDRVDLYEWMNQIIAEEKFEYPQKLCIEFTESLLNHKTEVARRVVLDMKLIGVRTMLTRCADATCPMSRITEIPVDMVLIAKEMTALAANRNKPNVFPSLVSYLSSMRTQVFAYGASSDGQIEAINHAGCTGYTVSRDYDGKLPAGWKYMPLAAALSQKETEDDE